MVVTDAKSNKYGNRDRKKEDNRTQQKKEPAKLLRDLIFHNALLSTRLIVIFWNGSDLFQAKNIFRFLVIFGHYWTTFLEFFWHFSLNFLRSLKLIPIKSIFLFFLKQTGCFGLSGILEIWFEKRRKCTKIQ